MVLTAVASLVFAAAGTLTVGGHTFHRRTLDNGLEALAVDDGDRGTISVFVVYAAGTRAETPDTTGLAHLVEHALFTGTARTPAGKHDEAVKALGGESNAYTRADHTVYYAHKVPGAALAQVLALEADRMRGLTWDEPAFLHERERLRVEEAGGSRSEVQVGPRRDHAMWAGRGYGAGLPDASGNTKGPTLTLAQARAFYDAWYHPRNAAVVVVGGEPRASLDAIERAFGRLPRGPAPPRLELEAPFGVSAAHTLEAPLTRDRLEWVWFGPSLAEPLDRVALELLAELLAGAAPGVEADMGGREGPDLFVLAATGERAAATLRGAWRSLLEGRWSDEQLAQARERRLARLADRPLRARPYFSLAVDVATLAALGHAEHAAAEPFVIDALSGDALRRAALRWLAADKRTTIAWKATATVAALPADEAGLRSAAEAAEASGDLPRAIAAYEKLIEPGPGRIDLVIFRYQLGALHRRLGKLEEARRQLKAGLAVVEYPALRDLLNEVEAELAKRPGGLPPDLPAPPGPAPAPRLPQGHPPVTPPGHPPVAPADPHGAKPPAKPLPPLPEPAPGAPGVRIHALRGEPPAWTAEAKGVMAQLERWRGLAFKEDVVVELREAAADGPAGWYEPSTKRLVVTTRGTERFGRGVMLHELFHALQDQQFDLSGLHGAADGPDADRALRGLIEGEAMLAVQELMDYDFAKHAQLPAEGPLDEARFEKVFHYGDGLQFVLAVRRAKGWEGVAAAFERPPRTTAELYHPDRWLAGWSPVGADAFARPVVGAGDAVVGNAPAGEYALRLLLARVPATRARAATLGSALQGDLLQSVKTAGGTVRHTWQLRLDGEAAAALEKVAATAAEAIPGALARSVSVTRQGQTVTIGWATKAE